jgi:hypothetical protein
VRSGLWVRLASEEATEKTNNPKEPCSRTQRLSIRFVLCLTSSVQIK